MIAKILFVLSFSFLVISFALVSAIFFEMFLSTPYYKLFRNNVALEENIKKAVQFYGRELDIQGVPKVELTVTYPKQLTFVHGYALAKDEENSYEIVIFLNHSEKEIIQTLAHEMVHIHQYHRHDLVFKNKRVYWKGIDHTDTRYKKRPWEVEAFKKEKALADKFWKSLK